MHRDRTYDDEHYAHSKLSNRFGGGERNGNIEAIMKAKGYILFPKRSCMALFGIFGSHTVEMCPLNNKTSAMAMVQMAEKTADAKDNHSNYGINKIIGSIFTSTRTQIYLDR